MVHIFDISFMVNKYTTTRTDESIFQSRKRLGRRDLLPAMLRAGVKEECTKCSLGKIWNGAEIVLQIDHEHGDKTNNELNNLRFLCPNCHSQCPTSFNRSSRTKNYDFRCKDCSAPINSKAYRCKKCAAKARVVQLPKKEVNYLYPDVEDIIKVVQDTGGWEAASRKIGIQANTLRKHLRSKGIDPKTIKYSRRSLGDL